ncbi:hypothetical protein Dimus_033536 [Dionaea muscipula]
MFVVGPSPQSIHYGGCPTGLHLEVGARRGSPVVEVWLRLPRLDDGCRSRGAISLNLADIGLVERTMMADLGSTGLGASIEGPTSIGALRSNVSSSPGLILMPDELNSILEVHRPEVLSDGGFCLGGSSVQVGGGDEALQFGESQAFDCQSLPEDVLYGGQVCDDELLTSASPVEVEGLVGEQGVVADDVLQLIASAAMVSSPSVSLTGVSLAAGFGFVAPVDSQAVSDILAGEQEQGFGDGSAAMPPPSVTVCSKFRFLSVSSCDNGGDGLVRGEVRVLPAAREALRPQPTDGLWQPPFSAMEPVSEREKLEKVVHGGVSVVQVVPRGVQASRSYAHVVHEVRRADVELTFIPSVDGGNSICMEALDGDAE